MKKTYLKPNTLIIRVENNLMLITSDTKANQSGEVLGREATFSDDDAEWFEE